MAFKVDMKRGENRPGMLLVVCILSWIYIGFYFVVTLYQLISGPISSAKIAENKTTIKGAVLEMRNSGLHTLADFYEKLGNMTNVLNENHYQAFSLTLLVFVIGFVGVSMMFLGRKLGFHLYIIYSILSIGQLYLFFSADEIPSLMTWSELIIAGIFIVMYAVNLKWMR